MKLEKEIHQTKFKDEYQKLAVNIYFTHGWLQSLQADLFKSKGISQSQYNILRILRGQYPKPAPVVLLKERMLDKMSDASRLVDRLHNKNYVTRDFNKTDRRKLDVKITRKGLKLLDDLEEEVNKFLMKLHNLNKTEAKQLNDLLDKLRG